MTSSFKGIQPDPLSWEALKNTRPFLNGSHSYEEFQLKRVTEMNKTPSLSKWLDSFKCHKPTLQEQHIQTQQVKLLLLPEKDEMLKLL